MKDSKIVEKYIKHYASKIAAMDYMILPNDKFARIELFVGLLKYTENKSVDYVELMAARKILDERLEPFEYGNKRLEIRRAAVQKYDMRKILSYEKQYDDLCSDAESIAKSLGYSEITADAYLLAILKSDLDLREFGFVFRSKPAQDMVGKSVKQGVGLLYQENKKKKVLLDTLLDRVKGQDEAVHTFVDGIMSAERLQDKEQQKGVLGLFVFAGPPGVGKSYLAQQGAEQLGYAIKTFDMSAFAHESDYVELIGSDGTWKGAHEGTLTSFVKKETANDKVCVLIFDEIEKAHLTTIHLFLQILDGGRLQDKFTKEEISFKNCILIFTTNAGRSLYEDGKQPPVGLSKQVILEAIRDDEDPVTHGPFFPTAILSRLATGHIVMFRHLDVTDLVKIGESEVEKIRVAIKEKYNINVRVDADIPLWVLLGMGGNSDARVYRAEMEKFVKKQIEGLTSVISEDKLVDNLSKDGVIWIQTEKESGEIIEELLEEKGTPSGGKRIFIAGDMEPDPFGSDDASFVKDLEKQMKGQKAYANYVFAGDYDSVADELEMQETVDIILLVLPHQNATGSMQLMSQNPIYASNYDGVRAFLDRIYETVPDAPVYVVNQPGDMLAADLRKSLRQSGVKEFISCGVTARKKNDPNALPMERIKALIAQKRVIDFAYRIARENKYVSYDAVPNIQNSKLAICLKNFTLGVRISGTDSDDMTYGTRMPKETFDDIIGGDTVKNELKEFIEYLKHPLSYLAAGNERPSGILFYGPPGTGKTHFAKAMAHEANVPFFSKNGSDFVEQYTGTGPQNMKKLFATARKYAPSIVFIDEFDAIGRQRTNDSSGKAEENTLNQFLSQLGGFDMDLKRPVFVIAATNYNIDKTDGSNMLLDQAAVSRFTRKILIDSPSFEDRKLFLTKRLEGQNVKPESIENLAKQTIGKNYRDMGNVVALALRMHKKNPKQSLDDLLDEAYQTSTFGEAKEINEQEVMRTAYHEAGHAFMNWRYGALPEYITVVPRGNMGGYVMPSVDENKGFYTKQELLNRISILMAGRAGEIYHFGKDDGISTGPSKDIKDATRIARSLICSYGMDEKMGYMYHSSEEELPQHICDRISELLKEGLERALKELNDNSKFIEHFVKRLRDKNKLTKDEMKQLFEELE